MYAAALTRLRATAPSRREHAKPADVPALLSRIAAEFDGLPRQQKAVATYLEQHRASVPVDRAGDIAARSGVQASTVVRFAQRLGFSGYTELQALFRREYTQRTTPLQNYPQRIRTLIASKQRVLTSETVAQAFVAGSLSGLTELARDLDAPGFEAAVALLEKAQNIYVVGVRRAFPVAAYIAYALQHTNKRVHLVDGIGGMYREQMRAIGRDDVVVAISFTPYGKETQYCTRVAAQHKAKALVITDSRMSPLARHAHALVVVKEGSAFAFRSLTSTFCLCQALFVALAYRLELKVEETRDPGEYDD
jgi:DNA-binding MurR/RpiR family transcriptional regulator